MNTDKDGSTGPIRVHPRASVAIIRAGVESSNHILVFSCEPGVATPGIASLWPLYFPVVQAESSLLALSSTTVETITTRQGTLLRRVGEGSV